MHPSRQRGPMRSRRAPLFVASLGLAAMLAADALPPPAHAEPRPRPASAASAMSMVDPIGSFAPMLERVIPGVVSVLVVGETLVPSELRAPAPFPEPMRTPYRSGGSGVIVDAAAGIVITNNHVVAGAIRLEVGLADGRRYAARLLGRDAGSDIAVVKIEAANLPSVAFGDSDKVRVGDVILAVGNPFGLESTATLGIVSALMRTGVGHEAFEDFMQIDAAINPGNSGGALVDVHGRLVGINTAGPGDAGRASGIGFAIPINMARAIAAELVKSGKVRRGSPGLVVEDLPREEVERLAMRVTRGARIVQVITGSPAEAAGIKVGTIVRGISGKPVRSALEFATRVSTVPIGTELEIETYAEGGPRSFKVAAADVRFDSEAREVPPGLGALSGVRVGDIGLGHPLLGEVRGVEVRAVPAGSGAEGLGLRPGDVLTSVDGASTYSGDDLFRRLSQTGMQYRLAIVRAGQPAWIRVVR